MKDILLETLLDGLKLLPFLFVAFLFIELLEHKFSKKTGKIIEKSGKFGPLLGGILGIIPQCGFSVVATNLYVTRIVSLGTLISIYLSTSDEMLPILISRGASFSVIGKILGIKVIIAIISGFVIDFLFRSDINKEDISKDQYHICEDVHCHCEDSIIKSSIKHTLNIFLFILGASFIINFIMEYVGHDILSNIFKGSGVFSLMLSSLIGLIPNCGASVIITELFLEEIIPLSCVISGLLTGSGVALLVLFRANKNIYENLKILVLVYGIGVFGGLFVEVVSMVARNF